MSARQAEIQAKMRRLQAELDHETARVEKRRRTEESILIPGTPSPKKPKPNPSVTRNHDRIPPPTFVKPKQSGPRNVKTPALQKSNDPSSVASALAMFNTTVATEDVPVTSVDSPDGQKDKPYGSRNQDMTVIEALEPGPYEHRPPNDDLRFSRLEPHSGINLKSRSYSHEDLQEFLRGRYYISPSKLYSVARLTPNRQSYEVPVAGDWVTIAVIAERGQINLSQKNAKVESDDESNDETKSTSEAKSALTKSASTKSTSEAKGKGKAVAPPQKKKAGKKYLTLKLVDFGSRSSDPTQGSKAVIKGDALLNMILFEADSYTTIEGGKKGPERVYRGGSGGAFESCAPLREGTVIAVMNARILKPFQRGTDKPHPTSNILAITPDSARSIISIGHSKDLGKCPVQKKDGSTCGSWCDRRVSDVCEYHVQHAVQSRRAGRSEFASSTSGMSLKSNPLAGFDPKRKIGLLPKSGISVSNPGTRASSSLGGGTTYVLPGQTISSGSSSRSHKGPEYLNEVMGRGRQEKKKRKMEEMAREADLKQVLGQDGGKTVGATLVTKAREALGKKGKEKVDADVGKTEEDKHDGAVKRAFSATAIQRIGFDPTASKGGRSEAEQKHLTELLQDLQASKKNVHHLGPRPGPKIRSGITAPASQSPSTILEAPPSKDDSSDSELEIV